MWTNNSRCFQLELLDFDLGAGGFDLRLHVRQRPALSLIHISSDAVKHDYHLVNPSPWPLIGSVAAFVMAVGGVIWMKGLFGLPKGTWWLLALGLAGVLLTMASWWTDVAREANQGDHTPVVSLGLRYGMILFIASEVMFFVAWFWICLLYTSRCV